ncbi:MAG: hypothetical protein AAFY29_21465 [Pseudomonadota bacterium]
MLKRSTLLTLTLLFASAGAHADARSAPAQAVEDMFLALSRIGEAEQGEGNRFADLVTADFTVFEVGTVYDVEAFEALLDSAASSFETLSWSLSEFNVTESATLAHVAYRNDGRFVDPGGNVLVSYWLESALLVMVDGTWRVKFLQSDLVRRELRRTDGSVDYVYPIVSE